MKRYIAILSCLSLLGCNEEYNSSTNLTPSLKPKYLNVTPTNITFSAEASLKKDAISITSMGTSWNISNPTEWISVTPTIGDSDASISIGVKENTAAENARVGIVYLNSDSWDCNTPIAITQDGAKPYININKREVIVTSAEHIETITIESNCKWDVFYDSDWLSVKKDNNAITISITPNSTSNDYRNATIVVRHEGNTPLNETIIIKQAPAAITSSKETIKFENIASSVTIDIDAKTSWTASTTNSWIKLSPKSGSSSASKLTIEVAPNTSTNERTGYVIINLGGEQKTQIPVKQDGIFATALQNELNFLSTGGTLSLDINSNTSWMLKAACNWIDFSNVENAANKSSRLEIITTKETEGSGNKRVNITASENTSTTNRNITIELILLETGETTRINVNQPGMVLNIGTKVCKFDDKPTSKIVDVVANGLWTATTAADWITLSPETDAGNSELTIKVSENKEADERSGIVTVKMGNKLSTFIVIQSGKYFTIDNSLLNFNSKGGDMNISISTNGSWESSIDESGASWLSLSESSGNGDAKIIVSAADNPSMSSRSASIFIDTEFEKNICINIEQKGRYLTIDASEVSFFAEGGSSEAININTDGKIQLICNDTWIQIQKTGNTLILKASENNSSGPRTGKVIIMMTDLEGDSYSAQIDIVQLHYGGSFVRKEYDEDKNWDSRGESKGTLSITPFGTDNK